MKLINLDNVISVAIFKEKKTEYKWFEETVVVKKYFLFFKDKFVVPAGFGKAPATVENVCYYPLGITDYPERHTKEWMQISGHHYKDGFWYKMATIEFKTVEGTIYHRFKNESELEESIISIRKIKPDLIEF